MASIGAVERGPNMFPGKEWGAGRIVDAVVYWLFGCYLLLVILASATGLVRAWQLAVYAVFLGVVLGGRLAADAYPDTDYFQSVVLSGLGIAFLVFGVLYQSSSLGVGFGPSRLLAVALIFLLTLTFLFVVTDARQYTAVEWVAVGFFAAFAGIYFAHTLAFHPSSSQSWWSVWAAVIMGSNLLVIPRLVPERIFLWFLSRIAAVVVFLGLFTLRTKFAPYPSRALRVFRVRSRPTARATRSKLIGTDNYERPVNNQTSSGPSPRAMTTIVLRLYRRPRPISPPTRAINVSFVTP